MASMARPCRGDREVGGLGLSESAAAARLWGPGPASAGSDSRGRRLGFGRFRSGQLQIPVGKVLEDPLFIGIVDGARVGPCLVGEGLIAPLQNRAKLRPPLHVLL